MTADVTSSSTGLDPGRLLALVDAFRRRPGGGVRRPHRRRVHLRRDLARLARGARPDPRLRLDRDRPRRRGQCRRQRGRARRRRRSIGVAGRDEPGSRLLEMLRRRVDVAASFGRACYRTPTKTRILAGGVHSAKQQVVRIDRATRPALPRRRPPRDRSRAAAGRVACDALLVSDYGTGLVTPAAVARARQHWRGPAAAAAAARRFALCAAAVSRHDGLHAERVGGRATARHQDWRRRRACSRRPAASCSRARGASAVLITRGSRGMALFEPDRPTVHIPIFGSDQIADVTGAGDTVIATMTLALASGATFRGGGAPGELRGWTRRDEARHRDGHRRRVAACGSSRMPEPERG